MKRFSCGFLISVSLPATDLLCSIKDLIFHKNSIDSFQTMSISFGNSHDLESLGEETLQDLNDQGY